MKNDARLAPLDLPAAEFRTAGHALVDLLADFLASWKERPVTRGETPSEVRRLLGNASLPRRGAPAGPLLDEAARLLLAHSLFNGHPRFFGYITSSAAPIGALADLLAAAVNPNVGGFALAPVATHVEETTVKWIAELLGFPAGSGLLVSGGNMANFIGFLAARRARAGEEVREKGTGAGPRLVAYASSETHTWLQKAADLFGLGTDALRLLPVDARLRLDVTALERAIDEDLNAGLRPFLAVGTAGTVSTGAIDPLPKIARLCRKKGLWFHVDAAYGGFAAALPDAPEELKGLSLADSVAVDPHKWLYAPLEAGCVLVRDPDALKDTFRYHPPYYRYAMGETPEDEPLNYYELGPQNSRGFRALKVWLILRQAGRDGIARMIADDIRLARELEKIVKKTPRLEAGPSGLSIATFRYLPEALPTGETAGDYLNRLNEEILLRLQKGGETFVSNAVVGGRFLLRACIVNFRTTRRDIEVLPEIVVRVGRQVDAELRSPVKRV